MNGANATPRTRRPALLARPVGNGMRNAALPQRATVELEFNFHNECGCANAEILPPEPSRDMRISNARFDCGCRPVGDAGCASSTAPQASGRPSSARVLPRPVRRAGTARARPYARRATARRPFPLTPYPPRCRTHLPHQHRWHTSWRSGARVRGGCRCRDGRIPPHARGARPAQEEALCDCPRSPQRGQNQRRRRPRPGAARSERGGHTHGWVQVR